MKHYKTGTYLSGAPLLKEFEGLPDRIAAERLGVNRMTLVNWRQGGRVHWVKADRYACRLGLHPYSVWGEEWFLGSLDAGERGL